MNKFPVNTFRVLTYLLFKEKNNPKENLTLYATAITVIII
jgi:hypothetical protein